MQSTCSLKLVRGICFVMMSDVLNEPLNQYGSIIPANTASRTIWKKVATCFLDGSATRF